MDRRGFMAILASAVAAPGVPVELPTTGPSAIAEVVAMDAGLWLRRVDSIEWELIMPMPTGYELPYEANE